MKILYFIIIIFLFLSIYISFVFIFYKKLKHFSGRIFLCSIYNNEADMLYIQVWRLYNYVDKFIISISNKTFTGKRKKFSLSPFEKELKPYMDKIDFVYYNETCDRKLYRYDSIIWCSEKSQRNYAKTYIENKYNPTINDLLIIVDIDEILTREGIKLIKENPPDTFYFLKGSMYFPYYYHKVEDWNRVCVIRFNTISNPLSDLREINIFDNITLKFDNNPLKPLVTHCSYCFNSIELYRNKLKSFSHEEFNKKPYITNNWIFKSHYCREKIRSPPGYDEPYEGWKHLIPDDDRLKYLIDPSFMYPLKKTSYTKKDLKHLCNGTVFRRKPFE